MQFGPLSSRQAIDKRFKELRTQSRQELLSQIYGKDNQKTEPTIEKELSQAFSAIMHSYDFDKANPVVLEIAQLFGLNLDSIRKMEPEQRQKLMQDIIQNRIQEGLKIVQKGKEEETMTRSTINDAQQNHFEWLGLRTKYTELRPIFEQILLQKVKLFDNQLTRLTEYTQSLPYNTIQIATTAREGLDAAKQSARSKTIQSTVRVRRVQSDIQHQFCNVKIRDKSEFLLKKWTQKQEESFFAKKAVFKSNLKINNIPVLFQFVKKYTETVKARDNIYRKWQQREKVGITPEEVRYLCATSLFLNNSLAKSQKRRIKNNIQSAGSHLISKLQTNIAEKIIETYHQLMKRVSNLRAKYYEELTQMRKKEQKAGAKVEEAEGKKGRRKEMLVKYKSMFEKIVNSQRMKLRLNERVFKWVKLFVSKLKKAVDRSVLAHGQSEQVFKRLTQPKAETTLLYKLKTKYPSSKIIKREDQYSHRLKYRVYIPSQRFHYEKGFEDSISKLNKLRLNFSHRTNFHKQISGGPKRQEKYVIVDLSKKQVYMSSPMLIKHIVAIQAKWRAVFTQKRFAVMLEESREAKRKQFAEKLQSLKRLYPPGKKIDAKAIEGRLRRVNMKISNILQPYVRVARRPINNYTSFCVNKLSANQLKNKHARNGKIRLSEFMKMVETNQYALLKRSGIVVTSREINDCIMGKGANAMWWAVYHSNYQLSQLFLEGGGDPNSKDSEENTCLHVAVKNGDVQIIFLLLDYGADLNRKNSKKASCLFHATKKMLKLLGLQQGSLLGEKDNNALFYRRTYNQEIYAEHYY